MVFEILLFIIFLFLNDRIWVLVHTCKNQIGNLNPGFLITFYTDFLPRNKRLCCMLCVLLIWPPPILYCSSYYETRKTTWTSMSETRRVFFSPFLAASNCLRCGMLSEENNRMEESSQVKKKVDKWVAILIWVGLLFLLLQPSSRCYLWFEQQKSIIRAPI